MPVFRYKNPDPAAAPKFHIDFGFPDRGIGGAACAEQLQKR